MTDFRGIHHLDPLIHQPSRLIITAILYSVESADFVYLLRESDLSMGNLSSHLSRLEEAGYVRIDKTFRGKVPRTLCALTDKGRQAFDEYRRCLRHTVDTLPE